jgi:hypothetical protein
MVVLDRETQSGRFDQGVTMKTFKIGVKVHWKSQSAGRWKTKDGVVIGIVQANETIDTALQRLAVSPNVKLAFDAGPSARNHESYIVDVNGTLYWPRASSLDFAPSEPHKVSSTRCEKPLEPGPGCDCQQCRFRKHCVMMLETMKGSGTELASKLSAAVDEITRLHAEVAQLKNIAGNAFVAGAKWWEFRKTGATMWQSDQQDVAEEASRRGMPFRDPIESRLEAEIEEQKKEIAELKIRLGVPIEIPPSIKLSITPAMQRCAKCNEMKDCSENRGIIHGWVCKDCRDKEPLGG